MIRRLVLALFAALALSAPAFADEDHAHKPKEFASVAVGMTALNDAIAQAKASAAGDMKVLPKVSEELKSIAGGLRLRLGDVGAANKERFQFNVDQVEAMHEQLEEAHEAKSKDDANRVIKRLEDVAGRLKSLAGV